MKDRVLMLVWGLAGAFMAVGAIALGSANCTPAQVQTARTVAAGVETALCTLFVAVADPATGEVIGHVCEAAKPLVDGAITVIGAVAQTDAGVKTLRSVAKYPATVKPVYRKGLLIGTFDARWADKIQAQIDKEPND